VPLDRSFAQHIFTKDKCYAKPYASTELHSGQKWVRGSHRKGSERVGPTPDAVVVFYLVATPLMGPLGLWSLW
jgi:hypothetical protein